MSSVTELFRRGGYSWYSCIFHYMFGGPKDQQVDELAGLNTFDLFDTEGL